MNLLVFISITFVRHGLTCQLCPMKKLGKLKNGLTSDACVSTIHKICMENKLFSLHSFRRQYFGKLIAQLANSFRRRGTMSKLYISHILQRNVKVQKILVTFFKGCAYWPHGCHVTSQFFNFCFERVYLSFFDCWCHKDYTMIS